MNITELADILRANGLAISENEQMLIERYVLLLREQNKNVNLISRKDEEQIFDKHILHSLTLAMSVAIRFEIPQHSRIFDIGSGGGLPGIPLAIIRPDLRITICDSIAKKIAADRTMIDALGLTNITTIVSRAEDLTMQKKFLGAFDIIVSRAVAPLDDLVKWTTHLLRRGGTLLALKGGDLREEIMRTKRMSVVANVSETTLAISIYNNFLAEEKKIVRVTLVS